MTRNFQHRAAKLLCFGLQPLLVALVQISGKEKLDLAKFQPQYHRAIVHSIRWRIEHTKIDTVDGATGFLITEDYPFDASLLQRFIEVVEAGNSSLGGPGPKLRRGEFHSDRAHSAVMINARMTDK